MKKKRLFLSFAIITPIYWLMTALLDYSETKVSYWQDLKANALPALAFGVFVTIVNYVMEKYFSPKK
ncbi:MAG: hypothetical protein JNK77_14975 [Saprospiraceae bacterium]|nr:hypothetical protein [Saprospiraceae bacterium]